MPEDFDVLQWKYLWDDRTRKVIEERVSAVPDQTFFNDDEMRALDKIAGALLPGTDKNIPIVESLGHDLEGNPKKGVRPVDLPWKHDMYKQGLAYLGKESEARFGKSIPDLSDEQILDILQHISKNRVGGDIWGFPADLFFRELVSDIATIYYSFPQAWNEIKFVGPVYPKGHYRLRCNKKMKFEPDFGER